MGFGPTQCGPTLFINIIMVVKTAKAMDKLWLGDVWVEYSACNIKGTAWRHAINIYI